MGVPKTGISAHDNAVIAAENTRQNSIATAAGSGAVKQANVNAAEVVYYKTVKASAAANGISVSAFSMALRSLGQTG